MKLWRIYRYYNPIEDKSYIGQTSMNVDDRANHGYHYPKGSPFREAIDKYGFDKFEQSILRLCISQEEADEYERLFIDKYNTLYPEGYNLESGGKSGQSLHSNTRCKLSNYMKETWRKPEVREKMSIAMKEAWNRPEYKQKLSDSLKGKPKSEEHKQHISESQIGLNTWSKEQKWFNNGTINIRTFECPEGFVPGRLKKAKV